MAAAAAQAAADPRPVPNRVALHGSLTPAAERAHPAGDVAGSSRFGFDLVLKLRDAAGAQKFVREVSTPHSRLFHKFLTRQEWIARYGPTTASIAQAKSWLRSQGFAVGSVPRTHLYVEASGTAAQVERAFGVTLGYYLVNGHRVRLASGTLTIPAALAGSVTGVAGVNEFLATNGLALQGRTPARPAQGAPEPPPPAGFRNPQPCTHAFNTKLDTTDSSKLYKPFTAPLHYDICGYVPRQLRMAYGIAGAVANGADGTGVAVAIVDAYDSPTLFADSQRYFAQNDGAYPLSPAQFVNFEPAATGNFDLCNASGWRAEQSLDVQAVHAMAPGALIGYFGAQDCTDTSLLNAVQSAVTSGASVVTNSWGDTLGDFFTDAATKAAFDATFMLADSTGVSVLFSSGDSGDNFAISGLAIPNYPPTSPFITAVGGTTLEINASGHRAAEFGWSTAKQPLCVGVSATNCGSATKPVGTLNWQAGGGGGSSYVYSQPFYQAGIVPPALAFRNAPIFGLVPVRVEPDISMDADAQSGMLIGLTQTFPGGVHYGQFKEGGTSLASPLLAGVIADAAELAGAPLGFLNPELYDAFIKGPPTTFNDIVPPANPNSAAVIRVDFANTVDNSAGYNVSVRAINYAGPETYCDGTGNCATRNVTLNSAPGFDGLTGIGSVGPSFLEVMSVF